MLRHSAPRKVRPDPSIERTSSSLALPVAQVYGSPSMAKPAATSHVKR